MLSETCFRLNANDAVAEGGPRQLHGTDQLVVSEDNIKEVSEINFFQENSTLNSLYYDDKNSQW